MRIIAGKYRGRNLKSPPSLEVRPTSDRLRETLFNVIAPRIEEARFLDLCAGSGAVGIEALSRGARHATFVDRSRKMCNLIKSNLELCGVDKISHDVVFSEAIPYLRRAIQQLALPEDARFSRREAWDIVFFDPPYADDYTRILDTIGAGANKLLMEDGLLIVEHHHKNDLPKAVGELTRSRVLKQGDSALSFYEFSARTRVSTFDL
jgi:16S rRNA (guanine(966)-N(2))-methyltransferase RsmD